MTYFARSLAVAILGFITPATAQPVNPNEVIATAADALSRIRRWSPAATSAERQLHK
jgi:hypothetical protein